MDALTRISTFFPTNTFTVYLIMSNLIINNAGTCAKNQSQLLTALLVIFSVVHFVSCFTDSYTASNGHKYWVFIMPFSGPLCFSLPSEFDKDRVYEFYYLRIRDWVHAIISTTTFVLLTIFTNPICMCLFPSGSTDGTAKFDPSVIRTVPILVAIIMAMIMVCLGEPRQMLGFQNVSETCPELERQMGDNPIYNHNKYPPPPHVEPSIPEGEEEGDEEMPPQHPPKYPGNRDYSRGPSSRDGGRDGSRTPPAEMYSKRYNTQHNSQQGPPPGSPRHGPGGGGRSPEPQYDE